MLANLFLSLLVADLAMLWEASGSDPSDCSNTYTHTSSGGWSTDRTWYSTSKPLSLSTCISLTWSLKLSIEMGFMRSTTATYNTGREEGGKREGEREGLVHTYTLAYDRLLQVVNSHLIIFSGYI